MKTFLIKFCTPIVNIYEYYGAYVDDENKLENFLYENYFDKFVDEMICSYYDEFVDVYYAEDDVVDDEELHENMSQDCSFTIKQIPEDELNDYASDGDEIELLYDGRSC